MTFDNFAKHHNFLDLTELEKVKYILFFEHIYKSRNCVTVSNVGDSFLALGLNRPNMFRLRERMRSSRDIVKGLENDSVRLAPRFLEGLKKKHEISKSDDENIITDNTIIPETLYVDTRGYIANIAKQINASYENNIFDGCAVLMRRLFEILLILTYEHKNRLGDIKDNDDSYQSLVYITNHARSNKIVNFSKEVNEIMDDFRNIGNFSAHKIQYNTKKSELDRVRLKYRVAIEELLYSSGLKA